ncbi:MAG: RagB/SusD family nutrient uptake outer membrane protein, partial [Bacteroides sp.]
YGSVVYTENVLMGAYSKLALDKTYGCRVPLNYATNSDIEVVGADATSYKEDKNRGLSNYLGTPGNNSLNFWEEAYYLIERTNLVIEGIEGSPILKGGDSQAIEKMNAFKGEALTLRAMIYFDLIHNWGDVPFKTEPTRVDGSNTYLPATDRDEIMEHLLADLEIAEDLVPWIGDKNYGSAERVTKGFIKGLAARIALQRGGYSIRNKAGFPTERGTEWEKYYTIANQKCKDIIENGKHKLNASYREVFENLNKLKLDQTYNENLFEVAHGLAYSGEMGYSIGVRYNKNSKYGYGNN